MLIAAEHLLTAEITADHVPGPGFVEITGGVISAVGTGMRQADVTLADGFLLPGLIDLQVNGYYGVEFQIADEASWAQVAARLPETGTTACLPTMITAPVSSLA